MIYHLLQTGIKAVDDDDDDDGDNLNTCLMVFHYCDVICMCIMFFFRSSDISPGSRPLWMVRNMIRFNGEELLAPRRAPKLYDHPLSAVRDYLLNIFAATVCTGDRSSIRNLRTQ
jgi:hypothetical protein